jgi:hypothetical protein
MLAAETSIKRTVSVRRSAIRRCAQATLLKKGHDFLATPLRGHFLVRTIITSHARLCNPVLMRLE